MVSLNQMSHLEGTYDQSVKVSLFVSELRLLFANRRDIRVLETTNGSSPRGGSSTITTIVDNLSDVTSLDWVGSTICWTDLEDGAIYCETDSKRVRIELDFIFERKLSKNYTFREPLSTIIYPRRRTCRSTG